MRKACENCGVEFNVRPCDVKRGRGKFCSHSCSAQVNNNLNLNRDMGSGIVKDVNYEKKTVTMRSLTQVERVKIVRDAMEAIGTPGSQMSDETAISIEEQLRLKRKAFFAKHGRCVENRNGREVYYDSEGREIDS